jgi:hypothetical protein
VGEFKLLHKSSCFDCVYADVLALSSCQDAGSVRGVGYGIEEFSSRGGVGCDDVRAFSTTTAREKRRGGERRRVMMMMRCE